MKRLPLVSLLMALSISLISTSIVADTDSDKSDSASKRQQNIEKIKKESQAEPSTSDKVIRKINQIMRPERKEPDERKPSTAIGVRG
ncbi:MAG: hypothetical protein ACRCR4_06495 [Thiotrichaceae bacterium]|uniref:Uncharacterized protein n=1 Tax=Candidatus Thiocaldithrix dubininis TaxID=3080823 RepID=A0AA95KHP8_9GAMM|nr:MAG: hypothetical protein QJT80_13215 [Candidatus Thiocaldithrix dubininis]